MGKKNWYILRVRARSLWVSTSYYTAVKNSAARSTHTAAILHPHAKVLEYPR